MFIDTTDCIIPAGVNRQNQSYFVFIIFKELSVTLAVSLNFLKVFLLVMNAIAYKSKETLKKLQTDLSKTTLLKIFYELFS